MANRKAPLVAPSIQEVGRNSHAKSIDDFNRQMRGQDWYQQWFRQQGLNPNKVHLDQGQRKQLQQVIQQNGGVPASAFNDMEIDPAGNLNTEHGFHSQPTWLKALEIGGAGAAGGYFAAPLFAGGAAAAPGAAAGTGAGAGVGAGAGTGIGAGTTAAVTAPVLAKEGAEQVANKSGLFSGLGKALSGDWGKMLTTGGLGLIEGLMQPKPQVRKGFKGDVDPSKLLSESNARLNDVFGGALKNAQAPVDFSNVRAQTPPGLSGVDPGMSNSVRPGMGDMDEMMKYLGMLKR